MACDLLAEADAHQAHRRLGVAAISAYHPGLFPEIHWQVAAGDLVTTYKTYHGTL